MSHWFECSDCHQTLASLVGPCPACGSEVVTIRTKPTAESAILNEACGEWAKKAAAKIDAEVMAHCYGVTHD